MSSIPAKPTLIPNSIFKDFSLLPINQTKFIAKLMQNTVYLQFFENFSARGFVNNSTHSTDKFNSRKGYTHLTLCSCSIDWYLKWNTIRCMELVSIDYTESPCKPHWYIIYSISEVFVHWYYFFKTRYWNYLILISTFFIRSFFCQVLKLPQGWCQDKARGYSPPVNACKPPPRWKVKSYFFRYFWQ